jgi:hypothetical protein
VRSIFGKAMRQGLCGLLGVMLIGCSTAENEMAGGNLQAVNHTLSAINWFSVNGYRAHGGWQFVLHNYAGQVAPRLKGEYRMGG